MTTTQSDEPDKIESVSSFISAVLKEIESREELYFRGSSSICGNIQPSVFRQKNWRKYENELFNSLLASHPDSFRDDPTTLDKLVRMQHHGLPTRLLDITSNPLVALYFAANSDPKNDGEVIRFQFRTTNVKYPDSDRASVMANLARLTQTERESICSKRSIDRSKKADAFKKLLHFIKQEKPHFEPRIDPRHINGVMVIRGKQSNARMIAQSGAFLLFGEGEEAIFKNDTKANDKGNKHFIVPQDKKQSILQQLDQLNINERTVFPGLESAAAYLKSKYADG